VFAEIDGIVAVESRALPIAKPRTDVPRVSFDASKTPRQPWTSDGDQPMSAERSAARTGNSAGHATDSCDKLIKGKRTSPGPQGR